jgi:hypothetical protein
VDALLLQQHVTHACTHSFLLSFPFPLQLTLSPEYLHTTHIAYTSNTTPPRTPAHYPSLFFLNPLKKYTGGCGQQWAKMQGAHARGPRPHRYTNSLNSAPVRWFSGIGTKTIQGVRYDMRNFVVTPSYFFFSVVYCRLKKIEIVWYTGSFLWLSVFAYRFSFSISRFNGLRVLWNWRTHLRTLTFNTLQHLY